jgi:hypothetical protein
MLPSEASLSEAQDFPEPVWQSDRIRLLGVGVLRRRTEEFQYLGRNHHGRNIDPWA